MFRWLERLVAHLGGSPSADSKWVEPSNAITRAILAGTVKQPFAMAEAPVAIAPDAPVIALEPVAIAEEPAVRVAAPVTRTAQRSRRRRASRAA